MRNKDNIDLLIDQLHDTHEPSESVWENIEAKINQKHSFNYKRVAASAACIGLISVTAILSFTKLSNPQYPEVYPAISQTLYQFEEQHTFQKTTLLETYAESEAATNNWKQQLIELEEARAVIKDAIKKSPDNLFLVRMLKQTYSQEIYLINKVHASSVQTL